MSGIRPPPGLGLGSRLDGVRDQVRRLPVVGPLDMGGAAALVQPREPEVDDTVLPPPSTESLVLCEPRPLLVLAQAARRTTLGHPTGLVALGGEDPVPESAAGLGAVRAGSGLLAGLDQGLRGSGISHTL